LLNWVINVRLYNSLYRAVEQMKRYRQMKDERDKLQGECCRLREQKDEFMNQCHQLRDKMGKLITGALLVILLVDVLYTCRVVTVCTIWHTSQPASHRMRLQLHLTRRAATYNMNQPTENRPTFNICNSSLAHSLLYHMNYKIDKHGTSSCKGTFGLLYFMGLNTMIFAVLKG